MQLVWLSPLWFRLTMSLLLLSLLLQPTSATAARAMKIKRRDFMGVPAFL